MERDPVTPGEPAAAALDAEAITAILGVTSLLVVELDREARIRRFNAACEQASGYPAQELLGQPIWRLIPEEQRAEVEAVFAALRDTGRASLHENDWLTRSGRRRRIAWSNAVVRGAGGAVERVLGTGIDVSELREAQSAGRESRERLDEIVDSAMDAILSIDESHRIVLFNPAAEAMFGRKSADMLGQSLDTLIPERFREAHAGHVERFARSGTTHRRMGRLGQVWGLRAGGEEFPVEASISRAQSGERTLLTVILRDTTERARAAETAALLESIVASSTDAVIATDAEGRILSWNPAAEETFGYSAAEALERPLAELAPPEGSAEIEELLARARRERKVEPLETRGRRKGGETFDVSLGAAPRRDGSGAVVGATLVARDISLRKELEAQLRRSEERASLGTLIAGLAHDIGTPMNVILGYIGMLARSVAGERERERLQIVREQVERVVNLVQTLMNFARSAPEKMSRIRAEEVLDRALDLIPEMAGRRGIAIERDFAETPVIHAQGDRLERAFLNLFVNACDAMRAGGVLRVSTEAHGDGVRIRIADTGEGIPPDVLDRIFEPFFTTKAAGQGSGLGLFVTRGIVLEQGGAIAVTSEFGRGTEFRIQIPAS